MARSALLLALLTLMPFGVIGQTKADLMTREQQYLAKAQAHITKFETTMEPEHLREASTALENVILKEEADTERRAHVRTKCLSLWLHLLSILDRYVDPNFDIRAAPDTLVQPPATSSGVVYPPGADPALIDDSKARAEYERAIVANRKKLQNYSLQVSLSRLNQQIPEQAEAFIRTNYTSAAHDQAELSSAIQASIKDPRRKEKLSNLLTGHQKNTPNSN